MEVGSQCQAMGENMNMRARIAKLFWKHLWENYYGAVRGEVIEEGFWGSSLGGGAGRAYSCAPGTGSRVLTNGSKNKATALCKCSLTWRTSSLIVFEALWLLCDS